jgi:hypothetical protein
MSESTNVQITYGHSPSDRRVMVGGVDISHIVLADGVDVEFAEHGAGVTLRIIPHRLDLSLLDPSIAVVTLTDEERDALAKGFSAYWAKDLCEEDAEFVQTDPESVALALDYADQLGPVVARIFAVREQALREEIRSLVTASKVTVHGRLALADTLTDWLAR